MKRELARLAKKLQSPARVVHWQGVYARASDVPVAGPGFDGETWLQATRQVTAQALAAEPLVRSEMQLLASAVALSPSRPVRILDFGGGMGIGRVMLRAATSVPVAYHVVEGERVCEAGRTLVPDITFETTLPTATFDIVYAGSSLQYIDDHDALFTAFARLGPAQILFGDVPAGAIPTFWTAQLTVAGSAIAYKFMNLDELVARMAKHGYQLLVRGVSERPLDVAALPKAHQLDRTCNLLFGR